MGRGEGVNGPAPPGRIRSSNPPGVGTGVIPASSQANSPKGLRRPPRTPQFRAIGVRRGEEKPAGEAGAPERALKARDRLVGGRVGVEGEDVPRCGDDRGRSEGLRRFSVRNTSMAASVSLLPIPRATRRRILGSIIVARQNVPFSSASESPFFTLVADVRPEGVPLPLIQMISFLVLREGSAAAARVFITKARRASATERPAEGFPPRRGKRRGGPRDRASEGTPAPPDPSTSRPPRADRNTRRSRL